MTAFEQVQSIIPDLSDSDIAKLDNAIDREQAARVARRNESLPDYPVLVSLDVPEQGHRAGNFVQVTKSAAVQLVNAGSHRLATPEEAARYTGQAA